MSKKQEKKKKKRQDIAKKRVLSRRAALRKQSSDDKKAARLDRKFRQKIDPIIKDPEKKKIMEEIKNQRILSKLEKNAEILKQLEEAYIQETEQKKKINDQLEMEGHKTLKEKLSALEEKAKETMTEEQKQSGMIDISN
jgi:hypothetical protein